MSGTGGHLVGGSGSGSLVVLGAALSWRLKGGGFAPLLTPVVVGRLSSQLAVEWGPHSFAMWASL